MHAALEIGDLKISDRASLRESSRTGGRETREYPESRSTFHRVHFFCWSTFRFMVAAFRLSKLLSVLVELTMP